MSMIPGMEKIVEEGIKKFLPEGGKDTLPLPEGKERKFPWEDKEGGAELSKREDPKHKFPWEKESGDIGRDIGKEIGKAERKKSDWELEPKDYKGSRPPIYSCLDKAVDSGKIRDAADGRGQKSMESGKEGKQEADKEREEQRENREKDNPEKAEVPDASDSKENKKEGLSDQEREKIKAETGWSDKVIDHIGSWEEYEIYKAANLMEIEINGKTCLIKKDIDWNQKDAKGNTNAERVKRGLAPLDKNGKPIELHHMGQRADAPLAELSFEEHRGAGNDTILHDKNKETETHGEGNKWNSEKQNHWKSRSEADTAGGQS